MEELVLGERGAGAGRHLVEGTCVQRWGDVEAPGLLGVGADLAWLGSSSCVTAWQPMCRDWRWEIGSQVWPFLACMVLQNDLFKICLY